jgi:hypothetical protein
MSHQPAPSHPRRIPRTLAGLGGLAVCLAAAIGLAPAAQAAPSPPTPSFAPAPPLPPPAAVPAHFPSWAIAAILAATIVLSVATTLITLALERLRWARREAAANPRTPRQQTKPRSLAATPHATAHKHQTGGRRSDARVGERDPQRLPHGITTRHVTQTLRLTGPGQLAARETAGRLKTASYNDRTGAANPIPAAAIDTATLPDSRRRGNLPGWPPRPRHVPLTPSQQFGTGSASISLTLQEQLRPRGNCPHCHRPRHQRTPSAPSRRMSAAPFPCREIDQNVYSG